MTILGLIGTGGFAGDPVVERAIKVLSVSW
jgi:hypothetical protein